MPTCDASPLASVTIAVAHARDALMRSSAVQSERIAKLNPCSAACRIRISTTSGNSLSSARFAHAYWPFCSMCWTACSVSGVGLSRSFARRKSSNVGVTNCGSILSERRTNDSKSRCNEAIVSSRNERVI
jgi:hypothetical protein